MASSSLSSIPESAFFQAYSLTKLELPESLTEICNSAFSGCSGLTDITLPKKLDSLGDYAFYNCSGISEIAVPESVTKIGKFALGYTYTSDEETGEESDELLQENFKISGKSGSEADKYAKENKITFVAK